jgi:hypothetical protein
MARGRDADRRAGNNTIVPRPKSPMANPRSAVGNDRREPPLKSVRLRRAVLIYSIWSDDDEPHDPNSGWRENHAKTVRHVGWSIGVCVLRTGRDRRCESHNARRRLHAYCGRQHHTRREDGVLAPRMAWLGLVSLRGCSSRAGAGPRTSGRGRSTGAGTLLRPRMASGLQRLGALLAGLQLKASIPATAHRQTHVSIATVRSSRPPAHVRHGGWPLRPWISLHQSLVSGIASPVAAPLHGAISYDAISYHVRGACGARAHNDRRRQCADRLHPLRGAGGNDRGQAACRKD